MTHRFNTYLEFRMFLKSHFQHFKSNSSVFTFNAIAKNVSKGCDCTQDKRIAKANKYYQKLYFSYDEQNNMKVYLNATKVEFRFRDELFLEF